MGDNVLNLTFSHTQEAGFQYGDYCRVYGELYKLNSFPTAKKLGENLFQYSFKMEGEYFDLSKIQFLFLGSDNTLKETDFTLMNDAKGFVNLLLANANRISTGWKKGDVQATIFKNLSFSKENCLEVLGRLADEFSLEWWAEGKTIHLSPRRTVTKLRFRQGRNKGLTTITRQAQKDAVFATRLYAFGSDKNLPVGYRNGAVRLKMTGGVDYIEEGIAQGIIEATVVFEDIYPHRTGKVTALGGTIYRFFDSGVNFDVNQYLLPGVEAKLTFQTGQLAGYQFKIKSFNPASGEFEILPNSEEKTLQVPSDLLRPQVGDKYVLTDITMPQSYIIAAEKELTIQASKLLQKISRPQYSYTIEFDPYYMKRRSRSIALGMVITIEDSDLGIDQQLTVVSCTRNLVDEYRFQIEVSDQKPKGTIAQIQSNLTQNARDIGNIKNTFDPSREGKFQGNVDISNGTLNINNIPIFSGNDQAKAGGLKVGALYYRIGWGLDIVI
jgi:hypothetical protein